MSTTQEMIPTQTCSPGITEATPSDNAPRTNDRDRREHRRYPMVPSCMGAGRATTPACIAAGSSPTAYGPSCAPSARPPSPPHMLWLCNTRHLPIGVGGAFPPLLSLTPDAPQERRR